jgi:hypothetical protein
MAVRDHAMLNTIESVGRIRWPNPLAESVGRIRWPNPLAESVGRIRWPNPLAESVGRIRWPVSPPFSSGVVASVVASYCSLRMPAGKPFPLAEHIEDECENRIKGALKGTPISCCCPCVPAISRIGMRDIFVRRVGLQPTGVCMTHSAANVSECTIRTSP